MAKFAASVLLGRTCTKVSPSHVRACVPSRFSSSSSAVARCPAAPTSSFRFGRGPAGGFKPVQWFKGQGCFGRRLRTVLAKASNEPEWYSANIKTKSKVGNDRYKFVLDVGQEVAKGYTLAGQFVQVTTDRNDESKKPAYIALANTPSEAGQDGLVEMVIKTNDGTAGAICDLGEGSVLDVSAVMGKGFNFADRAPVETCQKVYLIATGTGIAPIRALINSGELDIPKRKSVVLYYGYRNSEYCAYSEEIASWVSGAPSNGSRPVTKLSLVFVSFLSFRDRAMVLVVHN